MKKGGVRMNKLQLATIGTSWITDSFIEAALATDYYELHTVYSRSKETGEKFAKKYGEVNVVIDLHSLMEIREIDVVYVASPNRLHYEQALLALKAKKHVMVEKPATINVEQWDNLLNVATENDVFVLEAARHIHVPNLKKIVAEIKKLGTIRGGMFPFLQYSSRYDKVLEGEEPNVFSLSFGGGVLMDLGVYPIYTAVVLFGKPKEVFYFAQKIATGVDGIGTIIFRYDTFDLTMIISKNAASSSEVEIYGQDETLIIDHVTNLNQARLLNVRTLEEKIIELDEQYENNMYYEAATLAEMIQTKDEQETKVRYQEYSNIARIVSELLYDLRMQADIHFNEE